MSRVSAPVTATVLCMAMAAGLTACGAGKDPAAETASTKSPAVKDVPHFDPPVRFSPAGRPLLVPEQDSGPEDPSAVVLSGPTAYFESNEGLYAADVRSGAVSWTARPRTGDQAGGGGTPVLAMMGGRRLVVGVFDVTIPGQGTTPAQPAVEVLAVDPATGRPVLDDTLRLPPSLLADDGTKAYYSDGVVGADDKAIVIKMTYSGGPGRYATLVVDPATHRIRWSARDMDPVMASNGQIIATTVAAVRGLLRVETYKVQAIDAATKAVRWSTEELSGYPRVGSAGPGLLAFSKRYDADGGGLLDVSTGKRRAAWPKPSAEQDEDSQYDCVYDDRSVTICFAAKRFSHITGPDTTVTERILAYDTATATLLWELPKAGRVAPTITTAWHGAIYGTTGNGPVVLDARTGQDRETAPGVAPATVGAYGGLTKEDNGPLTFHAATG